MPFYCKENDTKYFHKSFEVLSEYLEKSRLAKKIQEATGEKLSTFYLMQSTSMAIQQGNAVCVRGLSKKHQHHLL